MKLFTSLLLVGIAGLCLTSDVSCPFAPLFSSVAFGIILPRQAKAK